MAYRRAKHRLGHWVKVNFNILDVFLTNHTTFPPHSSHFFSSYPVTQKTLIVEQCRNCTHTWPLVLCKQYTKAMGTIDLNSLKIIGVIFILEQSRWKFGSGRVCVQCFRGTFDVRPIKVIFFHFVHIFENLSTLCLAGSLVFFFPKLSFHKAL